MTLNEEQLDELRTLLDRHDEESECKRTGDCCAELVLEFVRELLEEE